MYTHPYAAYSRKLTENDVGKLIVRTKPDPEVLQKNGINVCYTHPFSATLKKIETRSMIAEVILIIMSNISGEKQTMSGHHDANWVVQDDVKDVPFDDDAFSIHIAELNGLPKKMVNTLKLSVDAYPLDSKILVNTLIALTPITIHEKPVPVWVGMPTLSNLGKKIARWDVIRQYSGSLEDHLKRSFRHILMMVSDGYILIRHLDDPDKYEYALLDDRWVVYDNIPKSE